MFRPLLLLLLLAQAASPLPRNIWDSEYKKRPAESFATQFEEPSREIYRYRAAIAGLMQLKPGMHVAEVGAGSGFLARYMAEKVGPDGRVYANELEPKMVAYMKERAAKEGLTNFVAVQGQRNSTGFQPETLDALAVVNTFSFFDQPAQMLTSIHASLRPNGLLLIVDFPREGSPPSAPGMDVDEILPMADAAGFKQVAENGIVPGHYVLIFRKR